MCISLRLVTCVFLLFPFPSSAGELPGLAEDCGRLLTGPRARENLYVYCPSLTELAEGEAFRLVIDVLEGTKRAAGETMIFFFSDESVLRRDRWPMDQGRLIDSWGGVLVGVYNTQSQILSMRPQADAGWRDTYLPTARN